MSAKDGQINRGRCCQFSSPHSHSMENPYVDGKWWCRMTLRPSSRQEQTTTKSGGGGELGALQRVGAPIARIGPSCWPRTSIRPYAVFFGGGGGWGGMTFTTLPTRRLWWCHCRMSDRVGETGPSCVCLALAAAMARRHCATGRNPVSRHLRLKQTL